MGGHLRVCLTALIWVGFSTPGWAQTNNGPDATQMEMCQDLQARFEVYDHEVEAVRNAASGVVSTCVAATDARQLDVAKSKAQQARKVLSACLEEVDEIAALADFMVRLCGATDSNCSDVEIETGRPALEACFRKKSSKDFFEAESTAYINIIWSQGSTSMLAPRHAPKGVRIVDTYRRRTQFDPNHASRLARFRSKHAVQIEITQPEQQDERKKVAKVIARYQPSVERCIADEISETEEQRAFTSHILLKFSAEGLLDVTLVGKQQENESQAVASCFRRYVQRLTTSELPSVVGLTVTKRKMRDL